MCDQATLAKLNAAPLTAHQYRTARRLLDQMNASGEVRISKADMLAICQTNAIGTMRAHLIALSRSGVLTYHIRQHQIHACFWPFYQTAPPMIDAEPPDPHAQKRACDDQKRACGDHKLTDGLQERACDDQKRACGDHKLTDGLQERACDDQKRACGDHKLTDDLQERACDDQKRACGDHKLTDDLQERAPHDQKRACGDHFSPATYTHAHAGELVSELDPILSNGRSNSLTNTPPPTKVEQSITFALLCQIRLRAADAKRLAAAHPLTRVREAVSHWWLNRKSVGGRFEETPGIVMYWLDHWDQSSVPELDSRFLHCELYRRFMTDEERAEQAAAMTAVTPSSRVSPAETATPTGDPEQLDVLWSAIINDYPGHAQEFLRKAHLVRVGNAQAVIEAPKTAAQWLQSQLNRRLLRSFKLSGQAVDAVVIQEVQLE